MQFACLVFEDNDSICLANTIEASLKSAAVEHAMALMRETVGAVGFQLWRDGVIVSEYFIDGERRTDGTTQSSRPRATNTSN